MHKDEFKRVLSSFADRPEDLDFAKNEVAIQIRGNVVTINILERHGQVFVVEDGIQDTAAHWIANRLANLPLLAERILQYVSETPDFIVPRGKAVQRIEENPKDEECPVSDVVSYIESQLESHAGFATHVLYLTSDAGEGKTTVINEIARKQAERFRTKQSDWLLVPIPLGGRPFLRLDEIISGSVANRYRFREFYYESFLELVKYGFLVPAFDGFEEMFVVSSSGEAVGSLGNQIDRLDSSGQIVVAARKAYFEIRDFESQARLFDTIKESEATFSRVKIDRWGRKEFLAYWENRGLPDGESVYDALLEKFDDPKHPVLSRAVLVRRLADIAADQTEFDELLAKVDGHAVTYFQSIIDSIILREIRDKWVDRSGDGVQQPLISLEQHHELLSAIAVEMARENAASISCDNLYLVAEFYCDEQNLNPDTSRQVMSRISDHPLLSLHDAMTKGCAFDHEEFREYFLGEAIARQIVLGSESELRVLLRTVVLSHTAIDACHGLLVEKQANMSSVCTDLQRTLETETPASYARVNCGALLTKIVASEDIQNVTIRNVQMPTDTFIDKTYRALIFRDCFFLSAVFSRCNLINCEFVNCRFDSVEIRNHNTIEGCSMIECDVYSILVEDWDAPVFRPSEIDQLLRQNGFALGESADSSDSEIGAEEDEQLVLFTRALRPFHRATGVNETVFKVRLGKKSQPFLEIILPDMLEAGVLREEEYQGGGKNRRFRLGVPMSVITDALHKSEGDYDEFLRLIASRGR